MKAIIFPFVCWFLLFSETITAQSQLFNTRLTDVRSDIILKDLKSPWSILELPNGNFLLTEKPGRLLEIKYGTWQKTEIQGLPNMRTIGQGGLLAVILHPDFNENNLVYFSYTKSDKSGTVLAIAKAILKNERLQDWNVIFESSPGRPGGINFGSRFAFDNNKYLYFSVGDRNYQQEAQDLSSPLGKIMRLQDDGSIPKDNPFVHKTGALPAIFSYGHRNPQGLFYDKTTNQLWSSEHGPQGGDEVNLILKGKNYGWPLASFGRQYGGALINQGLTSYPGTASPLWHWTPSMAPSDLVIYHGSEFPAWQGDLLVASLKFSYLSRLKLQKNRVLSEEKLFRNQFIRLRDLLVTKNGQIYIITDSGKLVKLSRPPT